MRHFAFPEAADVILVQGRPDCQQLEYTNRKTKGTSILLLYRTFGGGGGFQRDRDTNFDTGRGQTEGGYG